MLESTKNKHITIKKIDVSVICLIISDSLSQVDKQTQDKLDISGKICKKKCEEFDYNFIDLVIIPDEPEQIKRFIEKQIIADKINLIITIGGTGLSSRDITIETIKPMFEKELIGFGELFRLLTYQQLGTVSIMTRATAGIIKKKIIVCLPGSPNAVELGMDIISKEIVHIFNIINK